MPRNAGTRVRIFIAMAVCNGKQHILTNVNIDHNNILYSVYEDCMYIDKNERLELYKLALADCKLW